MSSEQTPQNAPASAKQAPTEASSSEARGRPQVRNQLRAMSYEQQLAALAPDGELSNVPAAYRQQRARQAAEASAATMPHAAAIQAAFGPHDISALRHVDNAEGARAARQMGAEAFTVSNTIVSDGPMSLHTAAHEAAHGIRQQAGHEPEGGVGEVGDAHEQLAEAVAERVVAGESAVDLLGPVSTGAGGGEGAVQCRVVGSQGEILKFEGFEAWLEEHYPMAGFLEEVPDWEALFDKEILVDREIPAEQFYEAGFPKPELYVEGKPVTINPEHPFAEHDDLVEECHVMLAEDAIQGRRFVDSLAASYVVAEALNKLLTSEAGSRDYMSVIGTLTNVVGNADTAAMAVLAILHQKKLDLNPHCDVFSRDSGKLEISKESWLGGCFPELSTALTHVKYEPLLIAMNDASSAAINDFCLVTQHALTKGGPLEAKRKDKGKGGKGAKDKGPKDPKALLISARAGWRKLSPEAQQLVQELFSDRADQLKLDPTLPMFQVRFGEDAKPPEKGTMRHRAPRHVFGQAIDEEWLNQGEIDLLVELLGERSAAGFIDHEIHKKRMGHLRLMVQEFRTRADSLRKSGGKRKTRVTPTTLVVDTNIITALIDPPGQKAPEADSIAGRTRARILELLAEHKITDIRVAAMNVVELYRESGHDLDEVATLPLSSINVTVKRDAESYEAILDALEDACVGANKGFADRAMMADVYFAECDDSGDRFPVQFMSLDADVVKRLDKVGEVKGANEISVIEVDLPPIQERPGAGAMMADDAPLKSGDPVKEKAEDGHKKREPAKPPQKPEDLLDCHVGNRLTVLTVMRFITDTVAADVRIVGGALRDLQQGLSPNDIDLACTADAHKLHAALTEEYAGESVEKTVVEESDLHLVQVGTGKEQLDISCNKAANADGELDIAADAAKRDFTMNTLSMGLDGEVVEGVKGARDDATEKNACYTVPLKELKAHLEGKPDHLARLFKFRLRGYTVDPATVEIARQAVPVISKAMAASPEARERFIQKTTASTPKALFQVIHSFGFPPDFTRLFLAEPLRGYLLGDRERPVYGTDLAPDLPRPESWGGRDGWTLGDQVTKKVVQGKDTGAVYQERRHVQVEHAPKKMESLVIDIDYSDHAKAGHAAPHHHIYRLVDNGARWSKNAAGLSHTGQPGEPDLDTHQYMGPTPWTWVPPELAKGGDLSAEELAERLNTKELPVVSDGEMLTFAGQITLHVSKVLEIASQHVGADKALGSDEAPSDLATLMLTAHNYNTDRAPEPQDEALGRFIGSSNRTTDRHRLRFAAQLATNEAFIGRMGDAAKPLKALLEKDGLPGRLRLYDITTQYSGLEDEKLLQAVVAADGADSVAAFSEAFELFLATGFADVDSLESGKDYAGGTTKVAGVDMEARRGAIKLRAGELSFSSAVAAAYHHHKHAESDASEEAPAFDEYLAAARDTVAKADHEKSSTEQMGTESHIFFVKYTKTIVRVDNGNAVIATFFQEKAADTAPSSSDSGKVDDDVLVKQAVERRQARAELHAQLEASTTKATVNQFQVDGARRACSAIALKAIDHFFNRPTAVSGDHIRRIIESSVACYRRALGSRRAGVQPMYEQARRYHAGPAEFALIDRIAGAEYLNPAEAVGSVNGLRGGATHSFQSIDEALDGVMEALTRRAGRTDIKLGATLVVGSYSVAFVRSVDRSGQPTNCYYYFDSHGDSLDREAFTVKVPLAQLDTLRSRAREGLAGRVRAGEPIGMNLFTPS